MHGQMPWIRVFRNEGRAVEIVVNKYGILQQNTFLYLNLQIEKGSYLFLSADLEGF